MSGQNLTKSYIIIPARLESTRLPKKLMLKETGKTLLQHTYEAALSATKPEGVIVASSDEEILREVKNFGGRTYQTRPEHMNGTSRVAEVAASLGDDIGIIVNLQGDEPLIKGRSLDLLISSLEENYEVATLVSNFLSIEDRHNPSVVKAAVSGEKALYFSRAPLRGAMKHIGVYGYSKQFLLKFQNLAVTPLAKAENLEQLCFLEEGFTIGAILVDYLTIGVDTPEDYDQLVRYYERS